MIGAPRTIAAESAGRGTVRLRLTGLAPWSIHLLA
jgi:hypothetical protein